MSGLISIRLPIQLPGEISFKAKAGFGVDQTRVHVHNVDTRIDVSTVLLRIRAPAEDGNNISASARHSIVD